VQGTHLHWYGKEIRPARKVGHLNICRPDPAALKQSLQALRRLIDAEERVVIDWALAQLSA
jgi:5-(carboxyamino)imidazole ribonucleotide synthase